tara:strand:+ start:3712 stop:3876 length:165 start_codon:yes stop_codon:yes gene_type:complete
MIKIKLYITLDIDDEEYAIPADGDVGSEIEDSIKDHLYDINGVRIKNMRTIQGD